MIEEYVNLDRSPGAVSRTARCAIRAQQATEHERVQRQHAVPIEPARNAAGVERGRLADERARAAVDRVDAELEPAAARQLQSRRQAQQAVWLIRLDAPSVDDVADDTVFGIAAGPDHTHAAEPDVDPAAAATTRQRNTNRCRRRCAEWAQTPAREERRRRPGGCPS